MRKVIATAPILNEEDYIWYVMESIYDVVDQIVLVEGSDEYSRRFDPDTGLSVDKTGKIIRAFKKQRDFTNKIVHIEAGRVGPNLGSKYKWQSEYYAEFLKPGDYNLLVSGDEIFDPGEVQKAIKYLDENPNMWCVGFEHLMFWKSFHQLLCVQNHRDIQPRLRIWQEGLYFRNVGALQTSESKPYGYTGKTKAGRCDDFVDEIKIYHMGWVRERKKFIEKRVWGLIKAREELNIPRLAYLKNLDDEDIYLEAEFQGKMFTGEYSLDEYIAPYIGPWPSVLLKHPWFNRQAENFIKEKCNDVGSWNKSLE